MVDRTVSIWCFLLFYFASECSSSASTPVLIWTNNENAPPTSALGASLGHSISLQDLQDKYLNRFLNESSKSTILFVQDKLSVDDLTKYSDKVSDGKTVFENLKKFLGTPSALTLPSVVKNEKHTLMESLKEHHSGHFEQVYSSDIDIWKYRKDKISNAKKNLFVFHLPPVKGSTETGKISLLSSNDHLMGKLLKPFASDGIYTAILTSMEPSDIVDKMQNDEVSDGHLDSKRHLLSTKGSLGKASMNSGPLYNISDCLYLYTTAIKFRLANDAANFNLSSHTLSGSCQKNQSSISIVFGKPLPAKVTKFDLRMHFIKMPTGVWACSSAQVTYSGTLNNATAEDENIVFQKTISTLTAPLAMSYACAQFSMKSNASKAVLTFDRFQVQPFGIKNNRFSGAFDCATFFTIPILTGLFVTAVLLSVLVGGIIAMMSISTMDRFDDPKGPCIQVPHE